MSTPSEPQVLIRTPDATGAYREEWRPLRALRSFFSLTALVEPPTLPRAELLAQIRAWRDEDEGEQRQAWNDLQQVIGEDRV